MSSLLSSHATDCKTPSGADVPGDADDLTPTNVAGDRRHDEDEPRAGTSLDGALLSEVVFDLALDRLVSGRVVSQHWLADAMDELVQEVVQEWQTQGIFGLGEDGCIVSAISVDGPIECDVYSDEEEF